MAALHAGCGTYTPKPGPNPCMGAVAWEAGTSIYPPNDPLPLIGVGSRQRPAPQLRADNHPQPGGGGARLALSQSACSQPVARLLYPPGVPMLSTTAPPTWGNDPTKQTGTTEHGARGRCLCKPLHCGALPASPRSTAAAQPQRAVHRSDKGEAGDMRAHMQALPLVTPRAKFTCHAAHTPHTSTQPVPEHAHVLKPKNHYQRVSASCASLTHHTPLHASAPPPPRPGCCPAAPAASTLAPHSLPWLQLSAVSPRYPTNAQSARGPAGRPHRCPSSACHGRSRPASRSCRRGGGGAAALRRRQSRRHRRPCPPSGRRRRHPAAGRSRCRCRASPTAADQSRRRGRRERTPPPRRRRCRGEASCHAAPAGVTSRHVTHGGGTAHTHTHTLHIAWVGSVVVAYLQPGGPWGVGGVHQVCGRAVANVLTSLASAPRVQFKDVPPPGHIGTGARTQPSLLLPAPCPSASADAAPGAFCIPQHPRAPPRPCCCCCCLTCGTSWPAPSMTATSDGTASASRRVSSVRLSPSAPPRPVRPILCVGRRQRVRPREGPVRPGQSGQDASGEGRSGHAGQRCTHWYSVCEAAGFKGRGRKRGGGAG